MSIVLIRTATASALVLSAALMTGCAAGGATASAGKTDGPACCLPGGGCEGMISHMVYFNLKTPGAENRAKLVAGCKKHLAGHEGVCFFAAGVVGDDFKREVNVTDYDVALILVFKDKAAHDKYQDHPRHLQFIAENKDLWGKVRVFDSVVSNTPAK